MFQSCSWGHGFKSQSCYTLVCIIQLPKYWTWKKINAALSKITYIIQGKAKWSDRIGSVHHRLSNSWNSNVIKLQKHNQVKRHTPESKTQKYHILHRYCQLSLANSSVRYLFFQYIHPSNSSIASGLTLRKKATIHQLTTMISTSKRPISRS